MNRVLIAGVTAAVVAGALTVVPSSADQAEVSKRGCSVINLGGPKIFTKHNMRCATAKDYARQVYRSGGDDEPRKFNCTSGSNFNDGGFCQHLSKDKYFGWHPADKHRGETERTKVLCWNSNFPNDGPPNVLSAPRKCAFVDERRDFRPSDGGAERAVGIVFTRKLRWKDWGDKTTVGKGEVAQPMNIDNPWARIRVKLSRPVEACGRTVYSKAAFSSPQHGFGGGMPLWTC